MKKGIYFLIVIPILIIISIFLYNQKDNIYQKDIFKMDTYINVKIYSDNKKIATDALKEIESIYNEYHMLTDRYNSYEGFNNVYYINSTTEKMYAITIDPKLYELLKYGKDWYYKSNGIKNINLGNLIDLWKKYRDLGTGIPTVEELNNVGSTSIEDIVLLPNNQIVNNHPNIDLGSIAKGYATQVVGEYLKSIGLTKFIINAGGNVLVGDHYADSSYNIGITDPLNKSNIFSVVKGINIAVVTSGAYERFYEYNGVKYGHIIDPNTLYPANNFASVTVVCDSSTLGDSLSLILFVMPLEDGKKFISTFDNVEAIWYNNDGSIVKSDGFNKYE
jgi:thiamine biosynthesis lipoprotein